MHDVMMNYYVRSISQTSRSKREMVLTSMCVGQEGMNSIALANLGICAHCYKGGADKRCSSCKVPQYCSKDCFVNHWKASHKKVCKNLAEIPPGWESEPLEINLLDSENEQAFSLVQQGLDLVTGKLDSLLVCQNQNSTSPEMDEGPKDEEKGWEIIMKAAELGNKSAQYLVATKYLDSDESQTLHWIRLAAENNHAEAQMSYGSKYFLEGRNNHEISKPQALV